MKNRINSIGIWGERIGIYLIVLPETAIGLALVYYSLRYTELGSENDAVSVTVKDNLLINLAVLLLTVLMLAVLRRVLAEMQQDRLLRIEKWLLYSMLALCLVCGGIWVMTAHVKPCVDGLSVYQVAQRFLQGDFPMEPPAYMSYNPHQYSLVFVLQLLAACFGKGNYLSFQIINLLLFPLMIYAGYRILKLLSESSEVCIVYLLLMSGYLPFYFYIPYVYGDFPAAACGMVIMWMAVDFCKTDRCRCIFGAGLAATYAYLVRKNIMIVIIAVCLTLVIVFCKTLNWKIFFLIGAVAILPLLVNKGIGIYYETVSGQKIHSGIPAVCYIEMGLEDLEKGPGWFNGDNYVALEQAGYDSKRAAAESREKIGLRFQELCADIPYAVDFFRRKFLTQWNMPDCYGIYETRHFSKPKEELPLLVRQVYYGKLQDRLQGYMNGYQQLLYLGFLLFAVFALTGTKREIEFYLLAAAVLGGMLFSLLWEAMSRYVLGYVGYMIPLAAIGFGKMRRYDGNGCGRIIDLCRNICIKLFNKLK